MIHLDGVLFAYATLFVCHSIVVVHQLRDHTEVDVMYASNKERLAGFKKAWYVTSNFIPELFLDYFSEMTVRFSRFHWLLGILFAARSQRRS